MPKKYVKMEVKVFFQNKLKTLKKPACNSTYDRIYFW